MANRSVRSDFQRSPSFALRWTRAMCFILLLLFGISAPSRAADTDCTKPTGLPRTEPGQPPNISRVKSELIYYECSGAYERDLGRVVDKAISYLQGRAKKGTKLALVLDIDETSLSNWEEMKANDFGLIEDGACELKPAESEHAAGEKNRDAHPWRIPISPCGFRAWILAAQARPLETLRLFQAARESKVAVFFITGRADDEEHNVFKATSKNLRDAGYKDWDGLLLEPPHFAGTIEKFKTEQRKDIQLKGYTIIANVGDQYSDLRGGYSERVFKLPNPFYFTP